MPLRDCAAIGHAVEKALAPVPGRVHADCEPDIPGSPERKCRDKSEACSHTRAYYCFAKIVQVDRAEENGQNDRRRPKTDPRCQRGLQIPSEGEFLENPGQQKYNRPRQSIFHRLAATQGQSLERKTMQHPNY